MKKFAFLLLSLALAFGCQPADEGGSTSGGDSSATESSDDADAGDTTDDSADATTDDATKLVALKITSPLR